MAKKEARHGKTRVPGTVLRLPYLDLAKSAVLNSLSSLGHQVGIADDPAGALGHGTSAYTAFFGLVAGWLDNTRLCGATPAGFLGTQCSNRTTAIG